MLAAYHTATMPHSPACLHGGPAAQAWRGGADLEGYALPATATAYHTTSPTHHYLAPASQQTTRLRRAHWFTAYQKYRLVLPHLHFCNELFCARVSKHARTRARAQKRMAGRRISGLLKRPPIPIFLFHQPDAIPLYIT